MDERYIEAVTKILEAELPDCNVESCTTIKNNGFELNGVRVATADSPIAPILYMNCYYEQGYTEEECAVAILEHYEEIKNEGMSFDINSLTDFDAVKDRICYKVINKEANEALLEYTPHTQLYDSDLVCIYYIDLDKQATITIHDGMVQMWGILEEQLFDIEDMMGLLHLGNKKINGLLKELESYGLVFRRHQGLGKPNKIYVNDLLNSMNSAWIPTVFFDGWRCLR